LNLPEQWGMLIQSFNDGRTEIYERDLGNGETVVTFVLWADEEPTGRR
jgi:hypothetical protein